MYSPSHTAPIFNHSNVPGPGSYDYNKEKSHNDLPKWSYTTNYLASKNNFPTAAASKIYPLALDLEAINTTKALYTPNYSEKISRKNHLHKRIKIQTLHLEILLPQPSQPSRLPQHKIRILFRLSLARQSSINLTGASIPSR